jgi:hypothetical protein
MDSRERVVMNQTCSSIVRMDWHIKFVCILDRNGKLLIGQSRSMPSISTSDKNTMPDTTNLKIDELVEVFLKHKNMYFFYSDYLLWIIENCFKHHQSRSYSKDYVAKSLYKILANSISAHK